VEPKRRLPVLKAAPGSEPEPDRPPWQWVGFGALAIFVVWLPLAWGASLVALRMGWLEASPVRSMGIQASGLALAAVAGGFLVGRWGGMGVGVREAALAGLTTGLVATMGAWGAGAVSLGALAPVVLAAMLIVAVPTATLGGWLGRRRRARGGLPA
jgi:hypothetical protein